MSVSGTLEQDVSASCPEGHSCMAVTNDVSAWCPVGPSCFSHWDTGEYVSAWCVCQWDTGGRCVSMESWCGGPELWLSVGHWWKMCQHGALV